MKDFRGNYIKNGFAVTSVKMKTKKTKEVGEDDVIRRKEKEKIYERRTGLGIRVSNF